MKSNRLSKSALKEILGQYTKAKQDSDEAYKKWSDLSTATRSLEDVLTRNGIKLKTEKDGTKSPSSKSSAATLRLAISEILKAEGKAIKASEIRERLKQNRIPFRQSYFWRVIGRMEGKGTVKRIGTGLYQLQNTTE